MTRARSDRIEHRIRSFLIERHAASRHDLERASPDAPLWNIVGSLTLLDLVTFIETAFGIEVRPLDFVPENFATLGRIARFIVQRRGAS